jgi:hypothetical protein
MVQSGREQLRHRDNSMLPSSQSGDQNVECAELALTISLNTGTPGVRP